MNIFVRGVCSTILLLSAFRVLYFRLFDFIPSTIPVKDSAFFYEQYIFMLREGWYASVSEGASPIFNCCVWLVDLLVGDPYQSLKLLSMISMFGTILLWIYFAKVVIGISNSFIFLLISFLIHLAFYRNAFFSGTNDGLFCLLTSFGVVFLFKAIQHSSKSGAFLSSLFFAFAFGTREIIVFYLPGIVVIWLLTLTFRRLEFFTAFYSLTISLLISVLIYFPALLTHHNFRFADKNAASMLGTWAEKNYLQTYLGVDQLTFVELDSYRSTHPEVKLPKTYSEAILLNPSLTTQNFFRQLTLIFKPFIWQIGLLFLAFLGIALSNVFRRNFLDLNVLSLLLLGSFSVIFSFLLINRVEFRWFMVFPFLISCLAISYIDQQNSRSRYLEPLLWINMLWISYLNFFLVQIW